MPEQRALAIDIGNSRIKAGLFEDDRLLRTQIFPTKTISEQIEAFVEFIRASDPQVLLAASVVPSAMDALTQYLLAAGFPLTQSFLSDGEIFRAGIMQTDIETPETTGVDRILASLAGLHFSKPDPTIVVTVGSAITVNLATPDHRFHGGAIFPGLPLMARALHQQTAALPEVSVADGPPAPLGRSTDQALQAGTYYACCGGIESLVRKYAATQSVPCQVILTGGDAARLAAGIEIEHRVVNDLVLFGLMLAHNKQKERTP